MPNFFQYFVLKKQQFLNFIKKNFLSNINFYTTDKKIIFSEYRDYLKNLKAETKICLLSKKMKYCHFFTCIVLIIYPYKPKKYLDDEIYYLKI